MAFSVGDKLGPYEITALLGKGGMGQVYKAHDPRLHRDVAIKVSNAEFSERFAREARAIAALNHPNICHLYDIGPNYLVMELVEGPTLSEHLKKSGAMPLEEALGVARQIADALEAAHEKNIIHRDLKPGNIILAPDDSSIGKVKVLDFGLAKVGTAVVSSGEDSPTVSLTAVDLAATEAGVVLGTAAYMSPEQARGRVVDKRADVWAFGVVLFEMLTGKRLFKGEDSSEILAAVIKEEPDFTHLPARVRPMLRRCLEKDPKRRLRDIADAMAMLEETADSGAIPVAQVPANRVTSNAKWIAVAAAFVVAVVSGVGGWYLKPTAGERVFQLGINPPEGVRFVPTITPFALSPDGKRIVFLGTDRQGKRWLWLRSLDSETATQLAGTEGAEVPFWSPDSRWVGFAANGKLQKLDITGNNAPVTICTIEGRAGGTWNKDGIIVFDQGTTPLLKVSADGGTPTPFLKINESIGETHHEAPYFLPDGQHLLYYSVGKTTNAGLASLDGKLNRILLEDSGVASYASNPAGGGLVVYVSRGQLLGRPFDLSKLELTGSPVLISDNVGLGRWWYASSNGLLAVRHYFRNRFQFTWVSRDGHVLGVLGEPDAVAGPRISPNQQTVVYSKIGGATQDVWIFDLARNATSRFTPGPNSAAGPIWSPDGKNVVYLSNAIRGDGVRQFVQKPASGVGGDSVLRSPVGLYTYPSELSRDGRWLVFVEGSSLQSIIAIQAIDDSSKVIRIQDHANERDGHFSPDGRWLVYSSSPAGRREIMVQSVPKEAGGTATISGKWQVSVAGGSQPIWRADGKEIYFVAPDGMMMAAPVESGADHFRPGTPKPLFKTSLEFDPAIDSNSPVLNQYDVTADGQRFLLNQRVVDANDAPITIVVNWPKLLEK